jgi:hypothetical protein
MRYMLHMRSIVFLLFLAVIIVSMSDLISGDDSFNATMTVKANIIGFANGSINISDVSIEVPDYIFLGNVTGDNPVSEEPTLYMNNTGKVPITVTPQLKDDDEIIFSYLFFRTQKDDDEGIFNISKRIGNFSMNIDKPASGSRFKSKRFYMHLDLTDFDGEINEDLIGYQADIIFLAMPQ